MRKLTALLFLLCINLAVQAQVSKTMEVRVAGDLSIQLTQEEKQSITDLTLTGIIDARDFNTMRKLMPALKRLDLSKVSIAGYTGPNGPRGTIQTVYRANEIPAAAFQSYSTVASVILPSSVTAIGEGAFWDCNWLADINIPSSVTFIGPGAFVGCRSLASITFPSTITTINERTFWGCNFLKSFTIPSSVTSIGANAFDDCYSLTSMIIPPSVDSIADQAFVKCRRILSFYIPSSVTYISHNAFLQSGSLTVDENNPNYSSIDGVLYNKDKTALLHYPTYRKGSFEIPSSVKSVGRTAFIGCEDLISIVLLTSITSLGEAAFYGCKKLTSITIPSSLTTVETAAFKYCSGLKDIHIPTSVTSIGRDAFSYCIALDSITIPSSVTTIERSAFANCTALKYISIPSSVTHINSAAFYGCKSLKSITLPSSIASISGGMFANCDSLTSVSIPSTITSIGNGAFRACRMLSSITIPASVTSIETEAFKDCSNLTSIYAYPAKPVDLCNSCLVFDGIDKTTCTLYVPFQSKTAYKNRVPWNTFSTITEMNGILLSTDTLAIPGNGGTASIQIRSNTSWTVTCDDGWLTILPSNGTGNDTLYFTVQANTTKQSRSAKAILLAEGLDPRAFVLTQNADITDLTPLQKTTINIYPNPVTDVFNVNYPDAQARIVMYKISGQKVLDKLIHGNKLTLGHLPKGVYNVRVICNDKVATFKLLFVGS